MNTYRVTVHVHCTVHPEVEAENEEDAMRQGEYAAEGIIDGWLSFQAKSVELIKGEESE